MHSSVGHLWTCCLPDYLVTISEHNVSSLAFGNGHCLFLTQEGKVFSFGKGSDGQLGLGDTQDHMKEPCLVSQLSNKISYITCGPNHSAALSQDGDVFMWGDNTQGQCGISNQKKILSPTKVQITGPEIRCEGCSAVENKKVCIIEVACGESHTLALSQSYELWVWGSGIQLGFANVAQTLPKKHDFLQNKRVLSVACGGAHSLVVVESPKYTQSKNEATASNQSLFLCCQCKSVCENTNSVSPTNRVCPLGLPLDKSNIENLPLDTCLNPTTSPNLLDIINENSSGKSQLQTETSDKISTDTLVECCISEIASDKNKSSPTEGSSVPVESNFVYNERADNEYSNCVKTSCSPNDGSKHLNFDEDLTNGNKDLEVVTKAIIKEEVVNIEHTDGSGNAPSEKNVDVLDGEFPGNILNKRIQEHGASVRHSNSIFDPQSAREFFSRQFSEISIESEQIKSDCINIETSEVDCADVEKYHDHLKMPFVKGLMSKMKTTVDKFNFAPFGHKISEASHDETNSDESFEVIESENMASASIDEIIPLRRTGSLKSLIEIRHTHHLKHAERKGSLESLMPKFWCKENSRLKISHNQRKQENGQACLQTELWSWGKGSGGVLGHGDELDRRHPCCVAHLSGQGVVKVISGGSHSIALTADCRVFSWGWNFHGQLGHSRDCTMVSTPKQVELPCHHLVWDVAAGDTHTLLLADLRASHVALYYCGHHEQRENEMCSCPKNKNVHHLNILKKTGLVVKVFSGGPYSGCVVDQQNVGEVPVLHEFAASERKYHYHLQVTLMKLLKAFLKEGVLSDVPPIFSDTMKDVIANFAEILDIVAMNAYDLTLLVQGRGSVDSLYMLDNENEWLEAYFKYSEALCDAVSVNAIYECVKVFSLSPLAVKSVARDIVGEAIVESKGTADTLHYLLQFPLKRPMEYLRLLTRLASLFSSKCIQGKDIQYSASRWKHLSDRVTRELHQADVTKLFWDSAPQKVVEMCRTSKRRLVRDSRSYPISLASSGRFSSHLFILFNDIFVHNQFAGLQTYALQVVWVESIADSNNNQNSIIFTTPEDTFTLSCPSSNEKTEWVCALNQAIRKVLDGCKSLEDKLCGSLKAHRLSPPLARQASYLFSKNPLYKDAVYSGMWICGKMHGHGELIWPDGRKYVGQFQFNMQHGEGVYTVPFGDKYQVYEGIWRDGKMNGFGRVRYPNNDVFEGYFKDDLHHGHGVLKLGQFLSSAASVYIGQWSHGRRQGYGVMDDICTGEKYMGLWMDDCRHGNGTVVTIDGIYYEGVFVMDKLSGAGVMMFEDNTCFEGELGPGGMLSGKGVLHLSNKDRIEGCFTGKWSEGIKISGVYYKDEDEASTISSDNKSKICSFNKFSVPANKKWEDVFAHCRESLGIQGINSTQDNERAWEAVAVIVNKGKHDIQTLSKRRRHISQECIDVLERIPHTATQHGHLLMKDYEEIKDYLSKACDCFFHPLGQLTERIVDVYRATYLGVGAHPRLLPHAVNEIHSFVERMYAVVRLLFPDLPPGDKPTVIKRKENNSCSINTEDEEAGTKCELVTSISLLHPILLPRLYPPLFTLYALSNEKEDEKYWERLVKWNKQSDIALMNFLGVDQKFWLISNDSAFLEHRKSFSKIKDEYFIYAVETLQHISTAFTALDKLKIVHQTFDEINKEVQRKLNCDFIWTMDDLFPVFQYIVVRARIRHLGSEIHLIDDLMDPHLQHGELGIMFTTLKACYFQIKTEKMPQL